VGLELHTWGLLDWALASYISCGSLGLGPVFNFIGGGLEHAYLCVCGPGLILFIWGFGPHCDSWLMGFGPTPSILLLLGWGLATYGGLWPDL